MQRRLIILAIAVAIGTVVYLYAREDASVRVKQTMLRAVSEMELSESDAGYVRGLMASGHKQAFDTALNSTRGIGRKFDADRYYTEIKRFVLDSTRAAGRTELAEHLTHEFQQLTFDAGER